MRLVVTAFMRSNGPFDAQRWLRPAEAAHYTPFVNWPSVQLLLDVLANRVHAFGARVFVVPEEDDEVAALPGAAGAVGLFACPVSLESCCAGLSRRFIRADEGLQRNAGRRLGVPPADHHDLHRI